MVKFILTFFNWDSFHAKLNEQSLQGMQLQEKEDRVKGMPKKLFKKNPNVKTAPLLWT